MYIEDKYYFTSIISWIIFVKNNNILYSSVPKVAVTKNEMALYWYIFEFARSASSLCQTVIHEQNFNSVLFIACLFLLTSNPTLIIEINGMSHPLIKCMHYVYRQFTQTIFQHEGLKIKKELEGYLFCGLDQFQCM